MKKLLYVSLLCIIPAIGFSQTQSDYEHVMHRFMKFYNNGNTDSISSIFFDNDGLWTQKTMRSSIEKYGKMRSFKYMGANPKDDVVLFKSVFTKSVDRKSVHAIGIKLEKDHKVGTFRFFTNSAYIDSLLKKF